MFVKIFLAEWCDTNLTGMKGLFNVIFTVIEKVPNQFQNFKRSWCPWPAATLSSNNSSSSNSTTPDHARSLCPGPVRSRFHVRNRPASRSRGPVHLVREHRRIASRAPSPRTPRTRGVRVPVPTRPRTTSKSGRRRTASRKNGTTGPTRTARTASRIRTRARGRSLLPSRHDATERAGTRVRGARGAFQGKGAVPGRGLLAERGVFPEGGIFITIIRCLFFLKNKDSKKNSICRHGM